MTHAPWPTGRARRWLVLALPALAATVLAIAASHPLGAAPPTAAPETERTVAVTGLALLPAFQNALEVAVAGRGRTGGVVAFVVAASPLSALGLPAAAWALLVGLLASGCLERADRLVTWRGKSGGRTAAPAAHPAASSCTRPPIA